MFTVLIWFIPPPPFYLQRHFYICRPFTHAIRQVVAEDKDSGVNGAIYYSLSDHNAAEFSIDASTGEITTATRLRGEVGALYRLTVVAHDRGTPSKSSTGFVEVRTSSTQVASLHFDNSSYTVYIPEHSPVDTVITKVWFFFYRLD